LLLVAGAAWAAPAPERQDEIPGQYRRWLDEEVVYIISPVERDVFLKLRSDRERELFIQAFWKHRDPTPGDYDNEFRAEHLRRINHADRYFGRGTPKPGWKTDRGRIYIMLGEPNSIQRFEGQGQVYPTEVWFYQGKTGLGLPPAFHLVFFQQSSIGEYRLYSPLADGPQSLLTSYYGDPMDYLAAFEQLREFAPDLSEVALSLIPGDSGARQGRPSLSSDLLVNKIESSPHRGISDLYARKFLEYKDIVEVEYSTNYMGCDSLVTASRHPSGVSFVHYAIEPERLSVNAAENRYYTTLVVNGTVSDETGTVIHQFEKTIPLQFDEEQIRQISHRPVSLRDMFPLIPGRYKLSILVKNDVSKEFTSLERTLVVPDDPEALGMTSPLLGYRMERDVPGENRLRPFQARRHRIHFQANRVFTQQDTLVLSYQLHGLSVTGEEGAEIRYELLKGEESFRMFSRHPSDYPDLPDIIESFPLKDFPPAHYRLRISVVSDGHEVVSREERFDITHADAMPRPWIYSKLLAPIGHPGYAYVLGTQLFRKNMLREAESYLRDSYAAQPDNIDYAYSLARLLLARQDHEDIPGLLSPFLTEGQSLPYDVYFTLGRAYQGLGEPARALEVYRTAVRHHGLNTLLLNALGECHYLLGQYGDAREAWQKSLEIEAEQPAVRKRVAALKEKK
jgi:GWxTD domain-containing protein